MFESKKLRDKLAESAEIQEKIKEFLKTKKITKLPEGLAYGAAIDGTSCGGDGTAKTPTADPGKKYAVSDHELSIKRSVMQSRQKYNDGKRKAVQEIVGERITEAQKKALKKFGVSFTGTETQIEATSLLRKAMTEQTLTAKKLRKSRTIERSKKGRFSLSMCYRVEKRKKKKSE